MSLCRQRYFHKFYNFFIENKIFAECIKANFAKRIKAEREKKENENDNKQASKRFENYY